jgi:ATP-dependent Lhr-like helicase
MGGKLSLSSELAKHIQRELERAADAVEPGPQARAAPLAPETAALIPLIELQARNSRVPRANELLAEEHHTREGKHLCVFPFAGRHVNAALAALVAWRLAREAPLSFSMGFNDYGFELLSPVAFDVDAERLRQALAATQADEDIIASVNAAELARRHFREIARVAGLVFQGYPGEPRSAKQLQASSGILYDVYLRHDPDNPLLAQARREVLERELDLKRLEATLAEVALRRIVFERPARVTPLALPLLADQMRNALSTEKLAERIARMQLAMQKPAPQARRRSDLTRDDNAP